MTEAKNGRPTATYSTLARGPGCEVVKMASSKALSNGRQTNIHLVPAAATGMASSKALSNGRQGVEPPPAPADQGIVAAWRLMNSSSV